MVILYALLAGILPATLWLIFWLREDNLHPEPRFLIISCFIAGMITVIFSYFFEKIAFDLLTDQTHRYITWAAIEEVLKFVAVVLVALPSRYMDEPIDAMIYCITVALGFAALENTLFIFTSLDNGEIAKGIVTGNMRFFGATLLHIVCSAVVGFMVGITFYKNIFLRTLAIVVGVILATALHAAFNLSIINETVTNTLKVFGWVWVGVVILIMLFEEVKGIKGKGNLSKFTK